MVNITNELMMNIKNVFFFITINKSLLKRLYYSYKSHHSVLSSWFMYVRIIHYNTMAKNFGVPRNIVQAKLFSDTSFK